MGRRCRLRRQPQFAPLTSPSQWDRSSTRPLWTGVPARYREKAQIWASSWAISCGYRHLPENLDHYYVYVMVCGGTLHSNGPFQLLYISQFPCLALSCPLSLPNSPHCSPHYPMDGLCLAVSKANTSKQPGLHATQDERITTYHLCCSCLDSLYQTLPH